LLAKKTGALLRFFIRDLGHDVLQGSAAAATLGATGLIHNSKSPNNIPKSGSVPDFGIFHFGLTFKR
jgi:hypothetical protein